MDRVDEASPRRQESCEETLVLFPECRVDLALERRERLRTADEGDSLDLRRIVGIGFRQNEARRAGGAYLRPAREGQLA